MSQDLASLLTGTAPAKAKTYDPFDAAVRTVLSEESDPTAQEWVAGVIANRAKRSGKNFYDVVTEKGQFEPWSRGTAQKIDPSSDAYKAAAARVKDILEGKRDPSEGATHFYAPDAQAKLGRDKPEFDDGTGKRVGSTLFFRQSDDGSSQLASLLTGEAPAEAAAPDVDKAYADTFGDSSKPDNPELVSFADYKDDYGKGAKLGEADSKLLRQLNAANALDPKAPAGDIRNPYGIQPGMTEKDVPPGAYYVFDGKIKRQAGGEQESSFAKGLGQGVSDVALSVGRALPGTEDSDLRMRLEAGKATYEPQFGGDLKSGLGRFTGQLAATAPALAGGEAVLAPLLGKTAAGAFALGRGGEQMAPGLARFLTRAGSLAARGGAEGAAGAGLVSSASDAPVSDQMLAGFLTGGALNPAMAGTGGAISKFLGRPNLAGGADLAAQRETSAAARGLPIEVPLSLGELTGAPAQQGVENAMLRGAQGDDAAKVVQAFKGEQQEAIRGNVRAISALVAGKDMGAGEGAKAISDTLSGRAAAARQEIDAAYEAARAKGEDAMLSTAKDVREGVLDGLRAEYDLERIGGVAKEVERFGEKGAPTVRELFETRTRLSNLTQSGDQVEAGAARKAIKALDAYRDKALDEDLFLGDHAAVQAWKDAIKKRADYGRLFEGNDLIQGLTEREMRSGKLQLKVAPEEAANYILGRSDLGFVGKKNLGRDLKRLQDVLGADSEEWNGLRSEVFQRIARAGEGAPEGGVPQFSGQKFLKAWEKASRDAPEVMKSMFTPEERDLINDFAKISQIATTPVKGGDNPSNSAIAAKRLVEPMLQFMAMTGGAGGGAVVGGPVGAAAGAAMGSLFKQLREVLSVMKARKVTYGAKPTAPQNLLNNPIISVPAPVAGGILGANVTSSLQQNSQQPAK